MKKLELEMIGKVYGGRVSSSACFFAPAAWLVSLHGGQPNLLNSVSGALMSACWNDHD